MYTYHARTAVKAGESEGPLSNQSSVIGRMTRQFEVVVLCKTCQRPGSEAESLMYTLVPSQEPQPVMDLVITYSKDRMKWGNSTMCNVDEVHPLASCSHRLFALPARIVSYPTNFSLCSSPITSHGTEVKIGTAETCSVDIALIPAWKTKKAPDLGSSFTAVLDPAALTMPTTAEVFTDPGSVDVVTNWLPASLEGTKGSKRGSLRYVYTMTPKDENASNTAATLLPHFLAGILEQARHDTSQSLSNSGIFLETFVKMPSKQVDYSCASVPILNVPVFDFNGMPGSGSGQMEYYDVTVTPQCKFDDAA